MTQVLTALSFDTISVLVSGKVTQSLCSNPFAAVHCAGVILGYGTQHPLCIYPVVWQDKGIGMTVIVPAKKQLSKLFRLEHGNQCQILDTTYVPLQSLGQLWL